LATTVTLQACPDYDPTRVGAAVRRALEDLPETATLLQPGRRVMLKPNILKPRRPEEAPVCTHPQVLRAVAELCYEAGCALLVADQPAYALGGQREQIFARAGYTEACRGLPVEFALATGAGYREFPVPRALRVQTAQLTRLLDEVDLVLNLPKLKTHVQTALTGAVKNTFGLVAPRQRMDIHFLSYEGLSEAIVDTFAAYRPQLSLMDAVVAMEGAGPSNGAARATGWIAASADAVALDAVAGRLAGFGPGEILTTVAATRAGHGQGDLAEIQILGEESEALGVRLRRARPAPRYLPRALGKLLRGLIYLRPHVAREKCTGCGACRTACPAQCIDLESVAVIDRRRCLECFCCMEACPEEAISAEQSWLARKL
jgi:uncharacterized protein (DUF362 family)/ferredoxin